MVGHAGEGERDALERLCAAYRPAILRFIRGRGLSAADADDVCQEVFVKLLGGETLARADRRRGRFRSLVLTVTRRTIVDRYRARKPEAPLPDAEPPGADEARERDEAFDREWVLLLAERAMAALREEGSPYWAVLRDHLDGEKQDRQKLWIARRKLIARIRAEVMKTCRDHAEFEDEVAYLSRFLAR